MQSIDAQEIFNISQKILDAADFAKSEDDIQTEVEHILRSFFRPIGIEYKPHHNLTVVNGRPDTLYGRVIIEYKKPGVLMSNSKRKKAIIEAQDRIRDNALLYDQDLSKYVGIITDGKKITFTKYRRNRWLTESLSDVNPETILRMLEYLRGLTRKPLHPDFMVEDFGPNSQIAKQSVQTFYESLIETKNERVKVIYEEWHRTFNQVCGYDLIATKTNIEELLSLCGLNHVPTLKLDHAKLLFSIHTYYALLTKFLAAEIAVVYASPLSKPYLDDLNNSNSSSLRQLIITLNISIRLINI